MSGSSFRELAIVMIDTSRTSVKAGIGLHDLLKTPSVDIQARVGLRKSDTRTDDALTKVTSYLVGPQLDQALSSGEDIEIHWPFAEGNVSNWTQAEAIWKYVLFNQLQLRRPQMESPVLLSIFPGLSRTSYETICQMFFERFNVAGFAVLDRPMAQFFSAITGTDLSGVVIDIGQDYTDISPIYEGFIVHRARLSLSYGISDCERYLAQLLRSNQGVLSTLFPSGLPSPELVQKTLVELARQVWQEGLVKVLAEGEAADIEEEGVTDIAAVLVAGKEKAVIETGMKKRANAKATAAEQARAREIEALDLVTVQFGEHTVTLGKERHRFCEPLFDPTLVASIPGSTSNRSDPNVQMMPLPVAIGHAITGVEVDYRQYVYQGFFVTGDLTNHVKSLGTAVQARLSAYILASPDQANEVQPKTIRVLKIPEYFAEYRDKGDGLASFLGSSIVAKLAFTDSSGKNFVSKSDYTSKGPKVVLEMSPCLL